MLSDGFAYRPKVVTRAQLVWAGLSPAQVYTQRGQQEPGAPTQHTPSSRGWRPSRAAPPAGGRPPSVPPWGFWVWSHLRQRAGSNELLRFLPSQAPEVCSLEPVKG